MYWPAPGIKRHPERRWRRPDRIFFGHGACHILAGVYLEMRPLPSLVAERIVPDEGFSGGHAYVTDGTIAFDHRGYSVRKRLLAHHARGWAARFPGWRGRVEPVDFALLQTGELNRRGMLGPDQCFDDPIPRARRFIDRVDHSAAARRAAALAELDARAGRLERPPLGNR